MKTRLLIITIVFLIPALLWSQNSDSKTGNNDVTPSDVQEIVKDRADELLGEAENTEEVTTETQTVEPVPAVEIEKPALPLDTVPSASPSGTPLWVEYFKNGEIGKISTGNTYFGVGRSRRNQAEADNAARVEFAKNVESRVDSSYEEMAAVSGKKEEYSLLMTTDVKTNISLKGISITEVFYDEEGKTYFSLIEIDRNAYVSLLEQNIREELALQEARLAQERARVETEAEEQRLADLEEQHRQEEEARRLEEERRQTALREQRKEVNRRKYAKFLEREPQAQLIDIRNGQLDPGWLRLGLSMGIAPGISPFDGGQLLQEFSFGLTLFRFLEIYGISDFQNYEDDFDWARQELGAKIRLLNNAGDTVRITLAAGGNVRFYDIFQDGGMRATFFASGVISMPVLLYSDISFYLGMDRLALGLTTQPLFGIFGDSLALIGEVSYSLDEHLRRHNYADGLLAQAGFRFKTGKHIATTLSFEDFSKVSLSMDLFFGKM